MKRTTIILTVAALTLLGIATGLLIWKTTQPDTPQTQAPTTTPATHDPAIPTAAPTTTDNGISIAYPDADQAPERPTTTPSYLTQEITQPTPTQNLDRTNPEATATEVLTLYTSRTSNTDTTYQDQINSLITEDLAQEIYAAPLPAFTNSYPIAVQDVTIGENIKEWGTDTPARYSHYATTTVATATHGNYQLNYRIAAINTPNGWTITDLSLDSWNITHG